MKRKQLVDPALPGRYGTMDAAELDREVEEFDREFSADIAEPLSAAERARERRARRRRGRPKVGKGAARVLITMEKDLLRRSDTYAKKLGVSRSALVARGLKRLLGVAD